MTTESVVNDILALEKRRAEAMVQGDLPELERLLHEEYVYVHSSGKVDDRSSLLERLRLRKSVYHDLVFPNASTRILKDTAVVHGDVDIHRGTDARSVLQLRFTNIWHRGSTGEWRNVHWHSSKRD